MIGRLKGIILEKQPPQLILDVSGVGYEISAPMSTFYHLPEIHHEVSLFTHLVVREDAQLLYGFYQNRERSLFRSLIKVNGVGPKLALTILSGIELDHFVRCIQEDDSTRLCKIPGIGKKTAERLIIETRDMLAKWQSDINNQPNNQGSQITNSNDKLQDAISTLIALGYKPNDAEQSITKIYQPDLNSENLIRLALKKMVGAKN